MCMRPLPEVFDRPLSLWDVARDQLDRAISGLVSSPLGHTEELSGAGEREAAAAGPCGMAAVSRGRAER